MDFSTLNPLLHAQSGQLEPLAKHIEGGGHICDNTRKFLAAHLRGEVKHKRGNRRTHGQVLREAQIAGVISILTMIYGTREKAIRVYCEEVDVNMNEDTLRTYLKRQRRMSGRRVSK